MIPLVIDSGKIRQLASSETIANSTLPLLLQRAIDAEYNIGNISGAVTLDCTQGNTQYATLTGNVTLTPSGALECQKVMLILTQDGSGSHTLTLPSGTLYSGGVKSLSTAAGAIDTVLLHFRHNGTSIAFFNTNLTT
jgi:hypothetical protein